MKASGTVYAKMTKQFESECVERGEELKHRVDIITFISQWDLSFHDTNQKTGSPHNSNFLGILKSVSQFDPFLAEHSLSTVRLVELS